MHVPDRERRLADIVLGFDDFASSVATDHYFGATCRRYGNRIKEGRFMLDGKPVPVSLNEAGNHLHDGLKVFHTYVWTAYPAPSATSIPYLHFSPPSPHGSPLDLVLPSKTRQTTDHHPPS